MSQNEKILQLRRYVASLKMTTDIKLIFNQLKISLHLERSAEGPKSKDLLRNRGFRNNLTLSAAIPIFHKYSTGWRTFPQAIHKISSGQTIWRIALRGPWPFARPSLPNFASPLWAKPPRRGVGLADGTTLFYILIRKLTLMGQLPQWLFLEL